MVDVNSSASSLGLLRCTQKWCGARQGSELGPFSLNNSLREPRAGAADATNVHKIVELNRSSPRASLSQTPLARVIDCAHIR
jgi:hypothetical protein